MQTKLLLSLLMVAPLLAQEAATPAPEAKNDQTQQAAPAPAQESAPKTDTLEPWRIGMVPNIVTVDYCMVKETKSVDKGAWKNCKTMLDELATLLKEKKFDEAGLLFDRINSSKPEGVKAAVVLSAYAQTAHVKAQLACASTDVQMKRGDYSCTLCEINLEGLKLESRKELAGIVFSTITANQELSYDQSKQMVLTLAAKN